MEDNDIETLNTNVKFIKEEGFYAKYTPKETIGYGITSVVRRCVNQLTQEEFAVKIIERNPTKDQEVKAEIFALSVLAGDPYVVSLIDVFDNENYFFLVFELAQGGELFEILKQLIVMTEQQASKILFEILHLIAHMHRLNIVHRDLKPENILLTKEGNVLVSDFGFAAQLQPNERLRDLCGTPEYLAPEVLKCSIDETADGYDVSVDLWACGVIAYIMLAGFSPFWHRKQNVMLWNIIDGKYNFSGAEWYHLSAESKDFISKLLVVDPTKRLTACEALKHRWFKVLQEEISKTRPRIKFRSVVIAIIFIKYIGEDLKLKKTLSYEVILENPYSNLSLRKSIDLCAFGIYGHWVKRSNIRGQNRAAIYENKPKTDVCDEKRCLMSKPSQYRLSFKYSISQTKCR